MCYGKCFIKAIISTHVDVSVEVTFEVCFEVVRTGQAFFRSFLGALSNKSCHHHFLLSPHIVHYVRNMAKKEKNHLTRKIQLKNQLNLVFL